MEIWKRINGFENLYMVSNAGIVKSLGNGKSTDSRTKIPTIIKTVVKKNGYVQVKLCKDGKRKFFTIHRLVAMHFKIPDEVRKEVNHIDGDKLNNHVDNLEWSTSSENQKHAFRLGLQTSIKGKDNKQSRPVIQLTIDGKFVKEWESVKQILREAGFNVFGIIKCCKKEPKYKTAYGYKWEYKDEQSS